LGFFKSFRLEVLIEAFNLWSSRLKGENYH
jgi:hypothetical protein